MHETGVYMYKVWGQNLESLLQIKKVVFEIKKKKTNFLTGNFYQSKMQISFISI